MNCKTRKREKSYFIFTMIIKCFFILIRYRHVYVYISGERSMDAMDAAHPANSKMLIRGVFENLLNFFNKYYTTNSFKVI